MKKLIVFTMLFLIAPFVFTEIALAEIVTVFNYQTGRYETYQVHRGGNLYGYPAGGYINPELNTNFGIDSAGAQRQAQEIERMRLENELLRLRLQDMNRQRSYQD